jgi:hypothetical protein
LVVNQTFLVKLDWETNLTKIVTNATEVNNIKGVKEISQNLILVNDAKVGLVVIDTRDSALGNT